jgi:hypothetical protein
LSSLRATRAPMPSIPIFVSSKIGEQRQRSGYRSAAICFR